MTSRDKKNAYSRTLVWKLRKSISGARVYFENRIRFLIESSTSNFVEIVVLIKKIEKINFSATQVTIFSGKTSYHQNSIVSESSTTGFINQ